jgi:uncharacterized LabA/DUF88 family protein
MGRAAIFIDAAYLDFMARATVPGWQVDHQKLVDALTPIHAELLRAYYYTSPPHVSAVPTADERARQRAFDRYVQAVSTTPRLDVRLGSTARRVDAAGVVRYQQKRVDLLLGVEMVRLATKRQITELHLLAGDSDFVPAVEVAKEEGVICVLHHGRHAHHHLRSVADECHRIDAQFMERVRRN